MSLIDQACSEGWYRAPTWAPELCGQQAGSLGRQTDMGGRLSPAVHDGKDWSPWLRVVGSGMQFDLDKFEVQFCDPAGNPQPTAATASAWRHRLKPSEDCHKPNFKTKQHGPVAVTTSSSQQWMPLDTCPRGSKVQLMFKFGLPRYEAYIGQPDAVAWAPMPDSPDWLKDLLSNVRS